MEFIHDHLPYYLLAGVVAVILGNLIFEWQDSKIKRSGLTNELIIP